jgi:hypothetical protein
LVWRVVMIIALREPARCGLSRDQYQGVVNTNVH